MYISELLLDYIEHLEVEGGARLVPHAAPDDGDLRRGNGRSPSGAGARLTKLTP